MLAAALNNIKQTVLTMLRGLDAHLTYHNIDHTIDVFTHAKRIAREEKITSEKELFLLQVAALYHDTGFLKKYKNHEEESCSFFLKDASGYSFTQTEERIVLGLINATRLPQTPRTHLEAILCDADLDYLGREDFLPISNNLEKEFLYFNIIQSEEEFKHLQLHFIQNHRYHTTASQQLREPVKQKHLFHLKT